jgi:hypothetical protein
MTTPIARHAGNHQAGEAMIPPPPYDPALVADAILHAATHRVREMTVGGVGRADTVRRAFSGDLRTVGADGRAVPVRPLETGDKRRRAFSTGRGWRVRSPNESGRRISLYTAGMIHPVTAAAATASIVGAIALYGRRRRPGKT